MLLTSFNPSDRSTIRKVERNRVKINTKSIRQLTFFLLVLIAISASLVYGIDRLLNDKGIRPPWFVSIPSISGIYYLLFYTFDSWTWKTPFMKVISGIKSPDLNGIWAGKGRSSFDQFKSEFNIRLIITQRATSVTIQGQFKDSKSISLNAGFEPSDIDSCDALFYFYRNEPKPDAHEDMAMHEGSVKLVYDIDTKTIKGSYYSGRDRNNHGSFELTKIVT